MTTFGPGGRDLTGWSALRALHESIYAKEELRTLEGRIVYETQMPFSSPDMGSPMDIRAGTDVQWNMHEDMLDHHWEMRRIDRTAPAWRALMPSEIDATGCADASCWIEIDRGGILALTHRDEGEETESTLRIRHARGPDGTWTVTVDVGFVHDGADSDALALFGDGDAMASLLQEKGWSVAGPEGLVPDLVEGEIRIAMPPGRLAAIDACRRKPLE